MRQADIHILAMLQTNRPTDLKSQLLRASVHRSNNNIYLENGLIVKDDVNTVYHYQT